jgi:hypothetical protein
MDLGVKEGYRRLRDAYVQAAQEGFSPLSTNKSIVQVGFTGQMSGLRPPQVIKSQKLDTMIDRVEPSNVVQIEVLVGSKNSPMAEELREAPSQKDIATPASAEADAGKE